MPLQFLLYGSYGYTGSLIVPEAVKRGLKPLLAGRDEARLKQQAAEFGLEYRAFDLDDTARLDSALAGLTAVLHCAGPFHRTYRPMVEACLRAGAHYLDLTGEMSVYQALADCDAAAKARGIMLLPGAGFDVAPTDCLAAHLKRRLPSATHLAIAFHSQGKGGVSRGTALGGVDVLPDGGKVRQGGRLVTVEQGSKTRMIDFGDGRPVKAHRITWGDVFTAYVSTGIPNIEDYTVLPPGAGAGLFALRYIRPLLGIPFVQSIARRVIRAMPAGPSAEARAVTRMHVWGEATDDQGKQAVARLHGPEPYDWTVVTSLAAMERVLAGGAPPGFQTPATAFGADFVLEAGEATREEAV